MIKQLKENEEMKLTNNLLASEIYNSEAKEHGLEP